MPYRLLSLNRQDLSICPVPKEGEGETLTEDEQAEWERIENRFDIVCSKAEAMGVSLLIDAEESWMQDAADELVERLMRKYNTKRTVVCNTLQMYRWDRLDYLKDQHQKADGGGYRIGYKLVRGAYMEKENARAEELGYPTPICASKADTDANFDAALRYILDHLDTISLFAGTHNEESSLLLIDLMKEKNIDATDLRVWFGQLYGMSDHISYNLSERGYNVAKYLPFGLKDVDIFDSSC